MVQPPGFNSSTHPKAICRLKKPLYGLKQYLHHIGFRMSKSDNSLCIRSDCASPIFIIIYVDDLVIASEHLVDQ